MSDGVKQKNEESVKKSDASGAISAKNPVLGGVVEIDLKKPLPKYDMGSIKAYRAYGLKADDRCFALICDPEFVVRAQAAEFYQSIINPNLPVLVAKGKVFWPPAGAERYVLVYRDVGGNRLKGIEGRDAFGWKQEQVLEVVVNPMMNILQDFRDKDFVHGSIRPSNMFDGTNSDKVQKVFLGDGLAVPCSYSQPALYEPIERAMSSPLGRGKAIQADDLYALGVSIAVLMRSKDPMAGLSDDEIIHRKMELGSYAAVTGKDRFKGSILELLRGLLIDDPAQRWTIDEVLIWLDGSRMSPKQAVRVKKAPRPILFNDKKYFYMQFLALDLPKSSSDLIRLVEAEELQQWIGRAFEDDDAKERLESALKEASIGGKGERYGSRLVAAVSCALDVMAPLRYKNLCLTADAFGNNLAAAIVRGEDINPYVELLSSSLILNWISVSENPSVDKGGLGARFDLCRRYLRQSKVGYGLERCLYVLSPEVHCLSDKLKNYHVRSPEDMIEAFEDICKKGDIPALFLDRHSAAFLSVKDPKCIDSSLFDLGMTDRHRLVLANLKVLAIIQNRGKLGPMNALAKTFLEMLPCVFNRYHDQKTRETLSKSVEKFAQAGDLVKMAAILDNPEILGKDMADFREAMSEYGALAREAELLEEQLKDKDSFGRVTGAGLSAAVSSLIAAVVIVTIAFLFFTGGGLF